MECEYKEEQIGRKLYSYLERNPDDYDVIFYVGPQRQIVKGLKVVLKAASPAFEMEFRNNWEGNFLKDRQGIPLPDIDPKAFTLFFKLLLWDTWSAQELELLHLSAEDMLNMIAICRRFGMPSVEKNLQLLTKSFFQDFESFIKTTEFLRLSRFNLEIILSNDGISMEEIDIFEAVMRWAEYQCSQVGLGPTGENFRKVLGDCLFQIRFPVMNAPDFGRVIRTASILTPEEQAELFKYITLCDEDKRKQSSSTYVPFVKTQRSMVCGSALSLAKELKILSQPPFVCDANWHGHWFQVTHRIAIHSLGFYGPIGPDCYYDVQVEIGKYTNHLQTGSSGKIEKRVFAQQHKIFHIIFDEPLFMEATFRDENWRNRYVIRYALKGPSTQCVQRTMYQDVRLEADGGIEFYCRWLSNQLAEIRFKK